MPRPLFRCRTRSVALHESLHGTASTVRRWVLIEEPGPWGANALRDNRLDPALMSRIQEVVRPLRLRVVLIRRVRRRRGASPHRRRCLLAWTGPEGGWVEEAVLDAPEQVLELDLRALSSGLSPGLRKVARPIYLVCTHGSHDPCCAERGRPVAQALADGLPQQTWEVSHIGGDRFAGNLLVLPQGFYYGRLSPDSAVTVAGTHERGEIEVRYFRGRTTYDFSVQAAECFLRARTGIRGIDELPLRSSRSEGDETEAVFTAPQGGSYRVRVRTTAASPDRALTCHARHPSAPPEHELVEWHLEPD
jgi:hypothetical protein